jgi:hypothetical protein
MRKVIMVAGLLACLPAAAFAKVALTQAQAPAGAKFTLHFRVTDGCKGGATNMISIAMPKTVINVDPEFVNGWTSQELHSVAAGDSAAWRDGNLAAKTTGDFPVTMILPKKPGPITFTATQFCGKQQENSTAVLNIAPVPQQ